MHDIEDMHDIDGLILIYQDYKGELFEQYASELPECGGLIYDKSDDMELIGYRTE